MKVFIITEGGKKIGFGHLARCLALTQEIRDSNREVVIKFIVSGDKKAENFLKTHGITPVMVHWVKEKNRILKLAGQSDLVVVDSYKAPFSFYSSLYRYRQRRDHYYHIAVIDNYNRLDYRADTIINPSAYGDKVAYKKSSRVRYLLGRDYIILRREFRQVTGKTIRKKIRDVLIAFGGNNRVRFIKKVVMCLSEAYPCFNYHVVSGKPPANLKPGPNLNFYSGLSTRDIRDLMLMCDVAISGGGQITYELAKTGVPVIAVCFSENQRFNLKWWKNKGFIEYAGWYNDRRVLPRLLKGMKVLVDYCERVKRSAIGKRHVDGKGVRRIAVKLILPKRSVA